MSKVQDRRLRPYRIHTEKHEGQTIHCCYAVPEVQTQRGVWLMAKLLAHVIGPIDEDTGEPLWEYWHYAQA